jgi:hypothetical protein
MIHASIPITYASYSRTDTDRLREATRILLEVQKNRKIDADINRALNFIASASAKLG